MIKMMVRLDDVHSIYVTKKGDDCFAVEMTEQCVSRVMRFGSENYSADALMDEYGVDVRKIFG